MKKSNIVCLSILLIVVTVVVLGGTCMLKSSADIIGKPTADVCTNVNG